MKTLLLVHLAASAALAAPPGRHELPQVALRPLPDNVVADIAVHADLVIGTVSPVFLGTNLTQHAPDKDQIGVATTLQRVRDMGVKTVRFPNGCLADRYNWRMVSDKQMPVERFIEFCDAIAAEPYYTLNMQGGTEGLEGAPPSGASIEERIRYRHTAPNPCGYTDYHFGTLAEAVELAEKFTVERALAGKTPITRYELGNENWGQAGTDWPPEIYGKTCEVYAAALRRTLAAAQKRHPELANLQLHITMVGFPTMGNNMDPFKTQNRSVNVAWTREVNRLADLKLIDAVQEHFYPYGGNDGSTLFWTIHNLRNILSLRYGRPNERLGGYVDPELAYKVPVEFTEWNVKCWGPVAYNDLPLTNSGFEDGIVGWTAAALPEGKGTAEVITAATRRGKSGLQLKTAEDAEWVEVRQTFSVAGRKPPAQVGFEAWIRTDHPLQVHCIARQVNAGEHQGAVLVERVGTQTRMWEHVVVTAAPFADTTDLEVAIRLVGPGLTAWVDEIRPLYWPVLQGSVPLAANRYEQQLFLVDALREMLEWPTPRTHVHHLFGNYPCSTLSGDGSERDNARAFLLFGGRIGETLVRVDCDVPSFDYDTYGDAYATDFNALAPDMKNIPALGVLATRKANDLFVLMINRTTDRPIAARIDFGNAAITGDGVLRTLSGVDLDLPGARISDQRVKISNPLSHAVPPLSAQMLHVRMAGGETSRPAGATGTRRGGATIE